MTSDSALRKASEIVHEYLLNKEPNIVPIYRIESAEGLLRRAITEALEAERDSALEEAAKIPERLSTFKKGKDYEQDMLNAGVMIVANSMVDAIRALKSKKEQVG